MSDIYPPIADFRPYPGWVGAFQTWAGASRTTIRLVLVFASVAVVAQVLATAVLILTASSLQTNAILGAYAEARVSFAKGREVTNGLLDRNRRDVLEACRAKGR